jgi:hypothetical protein
MSWSGPTGGGASPEGAIGGIGGGAITSGLTAAMPPNKVPAGAVRTVSSGSFGDEGSSATSNEPLSSSTFSFFATIDTPPSPGDPGMSGRFDGTGGGGLLGFEETFAGGGAPALEGTGGFDISPEALLPLGSGGGGLLCMGGRCGGNPAAAVPSTESGDMPMSVCI